MRRYANQPSILAISDHAAALSYPQADHDRLRFGIDLAARIMMFCQGEWYEAHNQNDKDWYSGGEFTMRKLHDELCREYYYPRK